MLYKKLNYMINNIILLLSSFCFKDIVLMLALMNLYTSEASSSLTSGIAVISR